LGKVVLMVPVAGEGKADQRIRAELLGHRRIDADAFAGCEPMGVRDVIRDGACGADSLGTGNRAAAKQQVEAEGGLRLHKKEGKALPESAGVSHCSRTRATRWDRPRHLRLSARSGPAQCCQKALVPGVYITVER